MFRKIFIQFRMLKLGQNLSGYKTGFVRPGHISWCGSWPRVKLPWSDFGLKFLDALQSLRDNLFVIER